jgi:hypothetical protein
MLLEILGYSALFASVAGSTIVYKTRYAFLFWMYSNPVFIYFSAIGYSLMQELFFISFSVMFYTAIFGFFFKKEI